MRITDFFALDPSWTLSGNQAIVNYLNNFSLARPFRIAWIASSSTGAYTFNFQIAGTQSFFFQAQANSTALFPTNRLKPFELPVPIDLRAADQLLISLTDVSGSSNTIQLVFGGGYLG
jgi:hypothetical protein